MEYKDDFTIPCCLANQFYLQIQQLLVNEQKKLQKSEGAGKSGVYHLIKEEVK